MVDVRPAQQPPAEGTRADRLRPRCIRCRNGDDVRRPAAGRDDGPCRGGPGVMLDQQLLSAPVLDHDEVDLDRAERVTYLLEQSFRYDYERPVAQLRHRLVVVPPQRHGNQHLRAHRLDVDGALARREVRRDVRGNTVVRLRADRVESSVSFRVGALLERIQSDGRTRVPVATLTDPRLLRATRLTAADDHLRDLAHSVAREAGPHCPPLELAAALCHRVHGVLTYEYG